MSDDDIKLIARAIAQANSHPFPEEYVAKVLGFAKFDEVSDVPVVETVNPAPFISVEPVIPES